MPIAFYHYSSLISLHDVEPVFFHPSSHPPPPSPGAAKDGGEAERREVANGPTEEGVKEQGERAQGEIGANVSVLLSNRYLISIICEVCPF